MRTRPMIRMAVATAAAALTLGALGAGNAFASQPQGKPSKPACCEHHEHSHNSVDKSRDYRLAYEYKKLIFANNQFGGANAVGHFYHGGNYAVGVG